MRRRSPLLALAFVSLSISTVLSQVAPSRAPVRPVPQIARTQVPHQKPCWEIAGISKSAMAERRQIEQRTRSEVQSVCNDSSLNEQQKHEKIRQIHQQSHQQVEALISPQQQEALKSCQQERAAAKRGGTGNRGGGIHSAGGPCGEMTTPTPEEEPEHP